MKINFTPGPSQLYFTVADHLRTAVREGIPSLSHRSKDFKTLYQEVVEGLQALMQIPSSHSIYLLGSASEIFERSISSLVREKSFHFVNGAFSQKYFDTAIALGKRAEKIEVPFGESFSGSLVADADLIALTHNETSTGVSFSLDQIYAIKEKNPDSILIVDAVSSAPIPPFDFGKIDSLFFSVQKGFGLPAGLGVWIVNESCTAKAEELLSAQNLPDTFHQIPSLEKFYKNFQTPETPNVLGIYLFSKVIQDFLRRGIVVMRNESAYKSALLYQTLNNSTSLNSFVKDAQIQSQTVIVAESDHPKRIVDLANAKGMAIGEGYGDHKSDQLRFANFPAHSKEQWEMLCDLLIDLN